MYNGNDHGTVGKPSQKNEQKPQEKPSVPQKPEAEKPPTKE